MSQTYDPTLATDRDHVRFLIGDTSWFFTTPEGTAKFSDEEIDATLTEQTSGGTGRKYCAAARLLSILQIRLASAGEGLLKKTVSELSREWGIDGNAAQVLETRIGDLRRECSRRISASPWQFRVAGNSSTRRVTGI